MEMYQKSTWEGRVNWTTHLKECNKIINENIDNTDTITERLTSMDQLIVTVYTEGGVFMSYELVKEISIIFIQGFGQCIYDFNGKGMW